jgi:hypothetical protein
MVLENLLIDRAIRGSLLDKANGSVYVSFDEITNPSIEHGGEFAYATDALGFRVAAFPRGKTVTFSAERAHIHPGLLAVQLGTEKQVASTSETLTSPKFEIITVGETEGSANTSITLSETPVGTTPVPFIYKVVNNGLSTEYPVAQTASASAFAISGSVITVPTGSLKTDRYAVFYEYEAQEAIKISDAASNPVLGGKFLLEVLFADNCNLNVKYHGFLVFPNVQMNPSFGLNFTTEGTHPFGFEAMPDKCSEDQELYHIIIPNENPDT